jgi:outer membrane protein assembly factor BamB
MRNLKVLKLFLAILSLILVSACNFAQSPWTHFRGSNLDGIAPDANLPSSWDDATNIKWKIPIHGKGWSSPVVSDNRIWMTTSSDGGKELYAVSIDFQSGKIIHNIMVFEPSKIYSIHDVNSYATPTPCIDQGKVYLHFGHYGTLCLDAATGEKIWERTDLFCEHVQGPGSSPIIHENMLILHMEGTDVQYVIALDKNNGNTIWQTHRPDYLYEHLAPIGRKAYITPVVINAGGRELLISNGSAVCIAYDVNNGQEVWRVIQGEDSTISMPFVWQDKVYFYTGFFSKDNANIAELLAVDPSGEGDVTHSHVLWRSESPILQLLTPVVRDGLIYTIDTRNVMKCIDSNSGEVVWEQRVRGRYNASPVYAAGKIFFPSTTGNVLVIREGKQFYQLAENQLDGEIWASPAIYDNSLLIRTSKFLYKIGE